MQVVVGEDKLSWQKLVLLTSQASEHGHIVHDRGLDSSSSHWLAMKARSIMTGDFLI